MEQKGQNRQEQILVGIDVGSTFDDEVAVMEAATGKVLLFSDYTRHHSDQLQVCRGCKNW